MNAKPPLSLEALAQARRLAALAKRHGEQAKHHGTPTRLAACAICGATFRDTLQAEAHEVACGKLEDSR